MRDQSSFKCYASFLKNCYDFQEGICAVIPSNNSCWNIYCTRIYLLAGRDIISGFYCCTRMTGLKRFCILFHSYYQCVLQHCDYIFHFNVFPSLYFFYRSVEVSAETFYRNANRLKSFLFETLAVNYIRKNCKNAKFLMRTSA